MRQIENPQSTASPPTVDLEKAPVPFRILHQIKIVSIHSTFVFLPVLYFFLFCFHSILQDPLLPSSPFFFSLFNINGYCLKLYRDHNKIRKDNRERLVNCTAPSGIVTKTGRRDCIILDLYIYDVGTINDAYFLTLKKKSNSHINRMISYQVCFYYLR